jgi:arylsulfatase I/J
MFRCIFPLKDYGWGNAGWHNNVTTNGQREVQTPNMNQLIAEGIELNQHYVFKVQTVVLLSMPTPPNPTRPHRSRVYSPLTNSTSHLLTCMLIGFLKFCSPTRSAIQSGRNPIHVNVQNVGPTYVNPADPVAGFSAIARNMTGMAQHMKGAGYATAMVGKWDAGMATKDHTPMGRGYEQR